MRLRFFQILNIRLWLSSTLGSLFSKKARECDGASVSQWGALCTALAATVGVGNIAGVASAIVCGGPGAVFWMWVAAVLGMITSYAENALGIFYRRKNKHGQWVGGAMYYLRDGLSLRRGFKRLGKPLALLFSFFCVTASFGIGNAGQVQAITVNFISAFPLPLGHKSYCLLLGLLLSAAAGAVILRGRTTSFTERLVPFMVIGYTLLSMAIILSNLSRLAPAVGAIFRHAFAPRSISGSVAGFTLREIINYGFRRGVFSNEAGMGSATIINSAANTKEPAEQGMWGIFQVFVDTVVMCTLTALTVLCSGLIDLESGRTLTADGERLVGAAFARSFGDWGTIFIAVSVLLFAFSSIVGWSCFGCRAWEFLFGEDSAKIYKVIFVGAIVPAAVLNLDLVWAFCDISNALMILPNLFGVIFLSPVVIKITKNYRSRRRGQALRPLISFYSPRQK